MFWASHELMVAAAGATRVQTPELVFAGELQYRFEFSHRMTPPQLLTNLFPVIMKVVP